MTPPALMEASRDEWLDINGCALRYRIEGQGDPIVLIHEIGGCLESWDAVAAVLAVDNTVIRYDQRSAGRSEKTMEPFTAHDLANDLAELLTALGVSRRVRLVGAAFGAAPALLHAAAHPDAVSSVALLAPALDIAPSSREILEARSHGAQESGMRSVLSSSLDRAWPESRRTGNSEFPRFRGRYLANEPHGFAQHNEALAEIELGDALERVKCPVLMLAGLHDVVRPVDNVQAAAERLPSATVVTIDAAHFIAAEAPQVAAAELLGFFGGGEHSSLRHVDIPEAEFSEEQRAAVAEAVAGVRGRMPAPMRAWLVNPELAARAQALGETLRYRTSLGPRLSELAIIVTARLWGTPFEWRVHSAAAAQAGLDPHLIESIRLGILPEFDAEDERTVVDVALALNHRHRIGDALFERATAVLGRRGLADLVGILGYYSLVSMTLNVYEIDTAGATSPFTASEGATDGLP
ncbi:pimeloyl-ACP methyl ester carboxylesterase [Homoserinimonas aerilata]|uniref:Pimeloyl-ACP methyl ester carboxylesterase n=1 Tax=Homoserinimonas aerilata TaxID=1162970 RepID=A0A542YAJ4_9MICO|nr:alpha/beta fold hydrolase [Homoserinimonas aerilata]TQL45032.1 pimeloyl-ACP methyl ester carboxylesterase [Homoserinimonas aerilata]